MSCSYSVRTKGNKMERNRSKPYFSSLRELKEKQKTWSIFTQPYSIQTSIYPTSFRKDEYLRRAYLRFPLPRFINKLEL